MLVKYRNNCYSLIDHPVVFFTTGSDDTMAAIRFSEEFANRYGDPHPSFFPGSLDDAIRESCNQPASNVIILFYSKLPFDLTLVGCRV